MGSLFESLHLCSVSKRLVQSLKGVILFWRSCSTTVYFIMRLQMAESIPRAWVQFLDLSTAALAAQRAAILCKRILHMWFFSLELPPLCSRSGVVSLKVICH